MRIPGVLVAILLSPGVMSPQDVPFTLRVDVPLVPVDFTVTDSQGQSVTDLTRNEFTVFDNGELRQVQAFAPVDTPFNIVLMLDCSDSTHDRMGMLVSAMTRFTDQLRSQDRSLLAVFGTEVHTIMDWNADKRISIDVPDSPICHGTNFYDALDWSERKLEGVTGRRGIIVFSDGQDSKVARKESEIDGVRVRRITPPLEDRDFIRTLRTVRHGRASLYFVAVDTDLNPGPDYAGSIPDLQQVRARMELLASASGGRIVFPNKTAEVVPLFLQIGRDLGTSYSLAFAPSKSKDSKPHHIEIRARNPEYVIHQSRETYTNN
jgi:VWFA-related protein